jgi:pterin-4a-carbinolamine dehydratase
MILVFNFFCKKTGEKLSFSAQNKAKLCKNSIKTMVFETNAIFPRKLAKVAENWNHT